jgi:TDG/mug DNA glycosylase family protein
MSGGSDDARPSHPHRPTAAELLAAEGGTVPDILRPGLAVVFCGINPSVYSAAVGHHFARPGNRFWPALHAGGFTPRRFSPWEDADLPALGVGLTNIVARATVSADALTADELAAGGRSLADKLRRHRPGVVAFLGIGAYRSAFGRPRAELGPQPDADRIAGVRVWVLPNPSGLNAHYKPADLARLFAELRSAVTR